MYLMRLTPFMVQWFSVALQGAGRREEAALLCEQAFGIRWDPRQEELYWFEGTDPKAVIDVKGFYP